MFDDICRREECDSDHIFIAATGERWHINAPAPESVAVFKFGLMSALADPTNRIWVQDIFSLRLISQIESLKARLEELTGGSEPGQS